MPHHHKAGLIFRKNNNKIIIIIIKKKNKGEGGEVVYQNLSWQIRIQFKKLKTIKKNPKPKRPPPTKKKQPKNKRPRPHKKNCKMEHQS